MKKISYIVMLLILSFLLPVSAMAQTGTTVYKWKKYNLSFEVPKTHRIIKSAADEWESGDEGYEGTWLELNPYKDGDETAKGIVESVIANDPVGYRLVDSGDFSSNGLNGYYATATRPTHPDWKFWVIGLTDPKSENNYYAVIWWKKNNARAFEIARKISASFKTIQ